eukprot:scaffold40693_cov35-Tisochrysis_lutea.AAC.1
MFDDQGRNDPPPSVCKQLGDLSPSDLLDGLMSGSQWRQGYKRPHLRSLKESTSFCNLRPDRGALAERWREFDGTPDDLDLATSDLDLATSDLDLSLL